MQSTADKLHALHQKMQQFNIDYYFVPSRDEHNNEYVPKCWQRREWLSGFDGSAGEVMVLAPREKSDKAPSALLWTDSRYFIQAEQQLDSTLFQLMKMQPGTPSITEWLKQQPDNIKVGVDPQLISIRQAEEWRCILSQKESELVALESNLIDQIWLDQSPIPNTLTQIQPLKYAGQSAKDKIIQLQHELLAMKIDTHVIVMLDAIAWLFNLRGNDIDFNPLTIAYAIITPHTATLFIDINKLNHLFTPSESKNDLKHSDVYFKQQGIVIKNYEDFASALPKIQGKVLLDPNATNWWIKQQLSNAQIELKSSPVSLMKAIKNKEEQQGMRSAHIEDATALINFFYWLEQNWQAGIDELAAAKQLTYFRNQQPSCLGLSFDTISAFGEHGAIVHYRVSPLGSIPINDSNLYLVDSGGQYLNGTTDVTRTLHLGQPTAQQKFHYTLVLKGHLALRHVIFPKGTCGYQLDSLARQFLWQQGLDYGHGTGHGVGCFLCVHEGPQGISPAPNTTSLMPGMMISNEPGVYLPGKYGIRIENVCAIVTDIEGFNSLQDLTLVPYALNLIDTALLSTQEIVWINEYHQLIYKTLALKLAKEERMWLFRATLPLHEI